MATTKKPAPAASKWKRTIQAYGPDIYTLGIYTIVDNERKAVLKDGRVIGYADTIEAAQALAEANT